jgi:hypothetical protein
MFRDGDEAKVLRKNVHVVRGRQCETGLEFTRQIRLAVEWLVFGFATGD